LLSSEGGASISETDDEGNTALLLATRECYPTIVQWLLEYGDAEITDTDNKGETVWTGDGEYGLPTMLRGAYTRGDDDKYVCIDGEFVSIEDKISIDGRCVLDGDKVVAELTEMLRVMVLHGGPPELLARDLAPPFQQIVRDGALLRAKLPAYLVRRRDLLDAHSPLLPPLRDLVHGYEKPTTTNELWATGLGAPLQRANRLRPERGQSPLNRSVSLIISQDARKPSSLSMY
jgi:hypothetical protein